MMKPVTENMYSGRPMSERTSANIEQLEWLICNQDDMPRSHKSGALVKSVLVSHGRHIEHVVWNPVQLFAQFRDAVK